MVSNETLALKEYLEKIYPKIYSYRKYGRLPIHEFLKVLCLKFGEISGYEAISEFRTGMGSTRIDCVWKKNNQISTAIEIDEGINLRAIKKMNFIKAPKKIFVFFDVKKMSQRQIDNFNFQDIEVIQLFDPSK